MAQMRCLRVAVGRRDPLHHKPAPSSTSSHHMECVAGIAAVKAWLPALRLWRET
jgi:hypothetical protein